MCDLTGVELLLAAAGLSIAGAIVATVVAATLNGSFYGAPGSPVAMAVAFVFTLAAIASLIAAIALVNDYFECMGSPDECQGELNNLIGVLVALTVVLGIQATACLAAAGIGWIPYAGQTPMYEILGSLIVQAPLIVSAIVFLPDLISCTEAAERSANIGTVIGTSVSFGIIAMVSAIFIQRKKTKTTHNG